MTAPQTITPDRSVSPPVCLEQPSERVSAHTASAPVCGPPTGVGRWARIAAMTGRVLDDLSDSVDTVLTPTIPSATAIYLLFLTR